MLIRTAWRFQNKRWLKLVAFVSFLFILFTIGAATPLLWSSNGGALGSFEGIACHVYFHRNIYPETNQCLGSWIKKKSAIFNQTWTHNCVFVRTFESRPEEHPFKCSVVMPRLRPQFFFPCKSTSHRTAWQNATFTQVHWAKTGKNQQTWNIVCTPKIICVLNTYFFCIV